MNTQPSTSECSDDQHWMISACATPHCVVCILPAHTNNPTGCHFSMATSLSLASSPSSDVSLGTRTLHDLHYPFPPLCKGFSHSLLPMPISEQKIRINPAETPAPLGNRNPPTFHPDSLRTNWSLRWIQSVLCKKQIHFQSPNIQNAPQASRAFADSWNPWTTQKTSNFLRPVTQSQSN